MKKFLIMFVCLMTMVVFVSCGTTYEVTANYDVCYPDGTKNFNETYVSNFYNYPVVIEHSYSGTNYISVAKNDNPMMGKEATKYVHFISTTAPVRLNSYQVENQKKKNKKNKKYLNDDMY